MLTIGGHWQCKLSQILKLMICLVLASNNLKPVNYSITANENHLLHHMSKNFFSIRSKGYAPSKERIIGIP